MTTVYMYTVFKVPIMDLQVLKNFLKNKSKHVFVAAR